MAGLDFIGAVSEGDCPDFPCGGSRLHAARPKQGYRFYRQCVSGHSIAADGQLIAGKPVRALATKRQVIGFAIKPASYPLGVEPDGHRAGDDGPYLLQCLPGCLGLFAVRSDTFPNPLAEAEAPSRKDPDEAKEHQDDEQFDEAKAAIRFGSGHCGALY
nr:hypothetical protein [Oleomonas cavernae]